MHCCHIAALLVIAALASGCVEAAMPAAGLSPAPASLDCQPVQRQPLVADVSLVGHAEPAKAHSYCNLLENDARVWRRPTLPLHRFSSEYCRAGRTGHWPSPRRLDRDDAAYFVTPRPTSRNRSASAGPAIAAANRRSGVGHANLQERLEQVNQTLADVGRLQAAGLGSPVSQPEVQAQRLDLEHKRIEVEPTIDQLNSQLANLLGQEPPPALAFWPDIDLKVDPAVPAVADAQSLAVVQRADLAVIHWRPIPATAAIWTPCDRSWRQSHAGLGLAASGCPLIALVHVRAKDDEASERQGQLLSAVADQERAARHDVAQAIAAIHARLAQIDLAASRRIEFLEQHREALRRRAEAAPAASFDARKATLDLLVVRQDLFHDVIEWKIAAVELRELEGELAIECGFTAALVCGGGQRPCW